MPSEFGRCRKIQNRGVAGTGEWIDYHESVPRHTLGNGSDIETNMIRECVTGALYCCAAENTDAAAVPFFRPHSVNAEVVGVREGIEPVSLDFCESQHFISFGAMKQQFPIVDMRPQVGAMILRHQVKWPTPERRSLSPREELRRGCARQGRTWPT